MNANDDRISRLEAKIEELETRLRAALPEDDGPGLDGSATSDTDELATGDTPAPDRRTMLRTLGLAGAAIAAGSASAVVSATPAAAADGGALLIGEDNVQNLTDSTVLKYTAATAPSAGNVVTVADTANGLSSFFPASLGGYAVEGKVNNGVYGYSSIASGNGVVGLSEASDNIGVGVYGKTPGAAGVGVKGEATATGGANNFGVKGSSAGNSGVGVSGAATAASGGTRGVEGVSNSPSGAGVVGTANQGAGIGVLGFGNGPSGIGVQSQGGLTGVDAGSSLTQLRLSGGPSGDPVAPLGAGLFRSAGEVVFDENRDLWVCVAAGTPGTWRRVSGPSTAGAFVPLAAPVRVYDSRPGFNPATGPKTKLTGGTPRTVDCTLNSSGVPVGASGVLVNLVSTGSNVAGDMSIYKDGIPYPGTSNVNFAGGQTVAVTTFSALSTAGKVSVRSNVGSDVVLDVLGFYQ